MMPARAAATALFLLLARPSILAATVPAAAEAPPRSFFGILMLTIMDNALALTILFILLSAIVGAVIKHRARDRVLREFRDYLVTVALENGKLVWGIMQVYPNGFELHYEKPEVDREGHEEASFVFHEQEFPAVRAIVRRRDGLTPEMLRRRRAELRRYVRPSFLRRTKRFLVVQFSILRDAFIQAFTVMIGAASRRATPGSVLQSQDQYISQMGSTVIGSVALANDPILESFFGRSCVVEVKEGEAWREIPCFLKEYSTAWLLLLRAAWPAERTITIPTLADGETTRTTGPVLEIRRERGNLHVSNMEDRNVILRKLKLAAGEERLIEDGRLRPGATILLEGAAAVPGAVMEVTQLEACDLILPRAKSVVRHRGGPGRSGKEQIITAGTE